MSGLVLLAIFLWTFIGHASFLAIIPNLTYKIVLYMTLASSVAILVTFILGIIGVSLTKGKKCIFFLVSLRRKFHKLHYTSLLCNCITVRLFLDSHLDDWSCRGDAELHLLPRRAQRFVRKSSTNLTNALLDRSSHESTNRLDTKSGMYFNTYFHLKKFQVFNAWFLFICFDLKMVTQRLN